MTPLKARIVVTTIICSLAAYRLWKRPVPVAELKRRLPRCLAGLACFGIGIAFFFASTLGTGPWDVLHGGIAKKMELPVGVVINLVGLLILPLWFPLREPIGLGTALNALEIGFVLDIVKPLLPIPHNIVVRVIFALVGLFVIALGSALYLGSGLGAGPRDGLMMGLNRLGLSIRASRTLIEAATCGLGWLLGGKVGFGTVLFMVGIGPVVQILMPHFKLAVLELSNDRDVAATVKA